MFDSGLHQGAFDTAANALQRVKNADRREQYLTTRWTLLTSDSECLSAYDDGEKAIAALINDVRNYFGQCCATCDAELVHKLIQSASLTAQIT